MQIEIVSELLDLTYRETLKNAGVHLEISLLDCLTTKKLKDFSKISAKSQGFPGLVGTMSNGSGTGKSSILSWHANFKKNWKGKNANIVQPP